MVISSAEQVGRDGRVMIDGTDNNNDVIGGSLINISQDAVPEFQIATNRFSAEYGRSASSVINVVTKGSTNSVRGRFKSRDVLRFNLNHRDTEFFAGNYTNSTNYF